MSLSGTQSHVLMYVKSKEACLLVISAAEKQNKLSALLTQTDVLGNHAQNYAAYEGNFGVIEALLTVHNIEKLTPLFRTQHYLRMRAFEFPNEKPIIDNLCAAIRPKTNLPRSVKLFEPRPSRETVRTTQQHLYGRTLIEPTVIRSNAIRRAIAQSFQILLNPTESLKYLQDLNAGFKQFYETTHGTPFEPLPRHYYDFRLIQGFMLPIPTASYQFCRKHSALQAYLVHYFKQHQLAQRAWKWSGFIPNEIADQQISAGDFIVESQLSWIGLLHGKLSHMIQHYILIRAIERGDINMTYQDGHNKHAQITIQEILTALVSEKSKNGNSLWLEVRDDASTDSAFESPLRLTETIMFEGADQGLTEMRGYMIDTFCKGLTKLHRAMGDIDISFALTMPEFVTQMGDLSTSLFETPTMLLQYELGQLRQKPKYKEHLALVQTDPNQERYIITPKGYGERG